MGIRHFLTSYIFGALEDNVVLFVYPKIFDPWKEIVVELVGYPFGLHVNIFTSNQPILWKSYYLLAKYVDSILLFNLVVFVTYLLSFLMAYLILKRFIKSRLISGLLSVTFLFSGYLSYQIKSHIDLAQIWTFLLFLYLLLRKKLRYRYVHLGLCLAFITGISNYIGYFTLLFIMTYFICRQVLSLLLKKENYWTRRVVFGYMTMVLVFTLSTFSYLLPYIKANYFNAAPIESRDVLARPLEDFVIFSSRPWYYVLPSGDNPFFGHVTYRALDVLQNNWGYFLTFNYFDSEHSASYLGWVNLILASVGFLSITRRLKKERLLSDETLDVLVLGTVSLVLFILTMPPYFTIHGLKIYMPSFLLWRFFPMFRSLSRLGVIILFITLIYTGYGYKWVLSKSRRSLAYCLVPLLITFTVLEFYIPLKLVDGINIPRVFTYIMENTDEADVLAVYPYSKTASALFWLKDYQRPLVNPRSFSNLDKTFESSSFTNKLVTCEGVLEAQNIGVDYIIVFYYVIDEASNQKLIELEERGILLREAYFSEDERDTLPKILRKLVVVHGTDQTDSATLYKISGSEWDCEMIPD